MTKPTELAKSYMKSFFGNEPLKNMEPLLADNLIFDGPFHKSSSAKEYLDALRKNPPIDVHYVLEEVYENQNSACLVYIFSKAGIQTRMAQIFEVEGEKICKIKLVFDASVFR
ncbi:MAG: nuclear transport factor 2 family protein [Candidatus Thiodiazotropha lotti]|uniref:Nuclear transport factor 2 family protein n=1 Tax=Candidatus Thiodiazotropha lotti TaxID=2792787 RepID=A0A9E4K8Y1_9GAMM|nr:nuclear transport factor 2 family protein [Candidatus Thiodiazotropha lotti]MCG7922411.1 nuclear transport factor 2 family protein [Candidatus Thiodiazotropha lotti]MCG7941332.1 nuclear transport factor 2 family protein [Candidatus Thiodiazotropha lotti]MCG7987174.1 nuclear transport factor 2 family protein [Candidatus Thiodiazotropha lotti]MCG8003552.1 nuclear transport factor 2 family protein [Candidatus Thiodiazotropha lotti]